MKTSYFFAVLSFALAVSAAPYSSANQGRASGQSSGGSRGGFFGGNNGGNKGGSFGSKGGNNNNNNGTAAGGSQNAGGAAGASNGTATASNNGGSNNATAAGSNSQDAQTSLTLDPAVIAPGFANNGQDVPAAGQVASLTSTNNFINFCLTVPNLKITNGQQITEGSCNPAPIGAIPSSDNMPSAKFSFPPNGGSVQENTAFTISMNIRNLETGNFVNADENFLAAPQQLNQQGQIIGHSHVVIEQLSSVGQTTPTDPTKFAFFKGLNDPAQNGALTADVTNGLPAGSYRLASINTNANHAPCVAPIAQHGSLDDAVYFTVTASGQAAAGSGANNSTGAAAGNVGAGNSTVTGAGNAGASNTGAGNSTVTGAGNAGNSTASGAGQAGAGHKGGNTSSKGNTGGQGRQGQQDQKGGRSFAMRFGRSRF